jgi:hypothetical protein
MPPSARSSPFRPNIQARRQGLSSGGSPIPAAVRRSPQERALRWDRPTSPPSAKHSGSRAPRSTAPSPRPPEAASILTAARRCFIDPESQDQSSSKNRIYAGPDRVSPIKAWFLCMKQGAGREFRRRRPILRRIARFARDAGLNQRSTLSENGNQDRCRGSAKPDPMAELCHRYSEPPTGQQAAISQRRQR